jgi:hypothetical protein
MARGEELRHRVRIHLADEAARIAPILRTDDLAGRVWIPATERRIRPISRSRWRRARDSAAPDLRRRG